MFLTDVDVLDGQTRNVMTVAVSEMQSSLSMLSDLANASFWIPYLVAMSATVRDIGYGSFPLSTRITILLGH